MMQDDVRRSKMLSLWLRHQPHAAGLTLDGQGWTDVESVLHAFARNGVACDWEDLLRIVEESDKHGFELSGDAERIRARQGHSVKVELDWPCTSPPALLYHGTIDRFLPAILQDGLRPMRRHHVHLWPDIETATRVATRRGKPTVLAAQAAALERAGHAFYLTSNRVWLTDHVPPDYLAPVPSAT